MKLLDWKEKVDADRVEMRVNIKAILEKLSAVCYLIT